MSYLGPSLLPLVSVVGLFCLRFVLGLLVSLSLSAFVVVVVGRFDICKILFVVFLFEYDNLTII